LLPSLTALVLPDPDPPPSVPPDVPPDVPPPASPEPELPPPTTTEGVAEDEDDEFDVEDMELEL